MAHDIEGNYAFFASGKPAWHKIGEVVNEINDPEEARMKAYPWDLVEAELTANIGGATADVTSHKAIFRTDGKLIGVVGKDYETTQPRDAWHRWIAPILKTGTCKLEAGGSLMGGKRMWGLLKVTNSEVEVVKGDTVKAYVLFYTGFDGSLSAGLGGTGVRVVCANTLAMAREEGIEFKYRHTKTVNEKLDAASETIAARMSTFKRSVEAYRALAARKVSPMTMQAYVRRVIVGDRVTPNGDISAKMETKVNRVVELLDTQRGLESVPAMRGTMWQAYNAVSEYVTHEAGRTDDGRVNSQWFGEGATLNRKAMEMALAV